MEYTNANYCQCSHICYSRFIGQIFLDFPIHVTGFLFDFHYFVVNICFLFYRNAEHKEINGFEYYFVEEIDINK